VFDCANVWHTEESSNHGPGGGPNPGFTKAFQTKFEFVVTRLPCFDSIYFTSVRSVWIVSYIFSHFGSAVNAREGQAKR
jgi:hypothetical protein